MYYLNNFGGCYTLMYAFVDKKEKNVQLGKIRYDQSVGTELTTVYEFISFEMIKNLLYNMYKNNRATYPIKIVNKLIF